MTRATLLLLLLVAGAAPAAAPTVTAMNAPTAAPRPAPEIGTTIVGDHDAAVGLYLVPWREEAASDIDRPPRLYDVVPQPLDAAAFEDQVRTEEGIAAFRRARTDRRR